jgi:hypothetical protein
MHAFQRDALYHHCKTTILRHCRSFLELDKALSVAQNYPVIYVAAEAVEDYEERVAAWEAHRGIKAGQRSPMLVLLTSTLTEAETMLVDEYSVRGARSAARPCRPFCSRGAKAMPLVIGQRRRCAARQTEAAGGVITDSVM